MDIEYRLVATHDAHGVSEPPPIHQRNSVDEMQGEPWIMYGVCVGSHVSVAVIQEIAGTSDADITRMKGKTMRQYGPHQRDNAGRDVSGKIIMNDVAEAFLFQDQKRAARWIRNALHVHIGVAPSLTWIDSGNANVGFLY